MRNAGLLGHPGGVQRLSQSVVPQSEGGARPIAGNRTSLARTRARVDRQLVLFAVEPTGVGPYVDAVQELIEQVVPQQAPVRPTPKLRVVR